MIPFLKLLNESNSSPCFTAAQLRAMRPKMQEGALFGRDSVCRPHGQPISSWAPFLSPNVVEPLVR
jgi:hypothetical protein